MNARAGRFRAASSARRRRETSGERRFERRARRRRGVRARRRWDAHDDSGRGDDEREVVRGDPTLGETHVRAGETRRVDARTATMCMLMIERRRGEASAWREYVDALPRRYDAPLSFSEEELERELKGTPAFAAAKAQRASATKMFEENIRPAVRALTQADNAAGGSLHVLPEVSEREFLWAYQTFWSRRVHPRGSRRRVESVVPGIDFVNHGGATKTNARWEHVVDANAPGGGYVARCGRRRDEDGRRRGRKFSSITAKNHPNRSSSRTDSPSRTIARRRTFSPFSHRGSTKRPRIVPSSSRRKSRALRSAAARLTLPATPSRRGVVDLPTDALRVLQIWTASSVDAVADVARDASSGRRPRRLSAAAADIRDALAPPRRVLARAPRARRRERRACERRKFEIARVSRLSRRASPRARPLARASRHVIIPLDLNIS